MEGFRLLRAASPLPPWIRATTTRWKCHGRAMARGCGAAARIASRSPESSSAATRPTPEREKTPKAEALMGFFILRCGWE